MDTLDKSIDKNEFEVNVREVKGKIDYMELVDNFGTSLISDDLIKRFEKVTGKPVHPWISRQIFFSHENLDKFLDAYEQSKPIFIHTGRGPISDSLHIGHLVPFIFTKWLQDVFNCVVIIQIADEEKYYFKDLSMEQIRKYAESNVKDIMSVGFNPGKILELKNQINNNRNNISTIKYL